MIMDRIMESTAAAAEPEKAAMDQCQCLTHPTVATQEIQINPELHSKSLVSHPATMGNQ